MTVRHRIPAVGARRGSHWPTVVMLLLFLAVLHGWDAVAGVPDPTGDAVVAATLLSPAVAEVHAGDPHVGQLPQPFGTHHDDQRPGFTTGACLLFLTVASAWLAVLFARRLLRLGRLADRPGSAPAARRASSVSLACLGVLRT